MLLHIDDLTLSTELWTLALQLVLLLLFPHEVPILVVGFDIVCIDLDTKELFMETLDEINTARDLIKLKPKIVRIYPVLVIKNTKLEKEFLDEKYIILQVKLLLEKGKKEEIKLKEKEITIKQEMRCYAYTNQLYNLYDSFFELLQNFQEPQVVWI